MPRDPEAIAADAAGSVAAGATMLHLHAFDDDGVETLWEPYVSRTVRAVRARCPGVPINMTTFAEIEPDPAARLAAIMAWQELPDLIPANQGETGVDEITRFLLGQGVGVEACLLSLQEAEAFTAAPPPHHYRRIVVEPQESDSGEAVATARAIEQVLVASGSTLEQVHHGVGPTTWPVLRWAAGRGHGVRIGLEDTALLPDGQAASGNAELVSAAADVLSHRTSPTASHTPRRSRP